MAKKRTVRLAATPPELQENTHPEPRPGKVPIRSAPSAFPRAPETPPEADAVHVAPAVPQLDASARERDAYWRDGRDTIPQQANYRIPRWLHDKLRSIALHLDVDQTELVTKALERLVREIEADHGRSFPYLPRKGDSERGPSYTT
ncbi:MAG: hypothetical protein R3181_00295 [Rubricoccaceae bacterium]|nr:hypothetical protein [Rubricoccaceae bacterium]